MKEFKRMVKEKAELVKGRDDLIKENSGIDEKIEEVSNGEGSPVSKMKAKKELRGKKSENQEMIVYFDEDIKKLEGKIKTKVFAISNSEFTKTLYGFDTKVLDKSVIEYIKLKEGFEAALEKAYSDRQAFIDKTFTQEEQEEYTSHKEFAMGTGYTFDDVLRRV